jgi:hypothetical protein
MYASHDFRIWVAEPRVEVIVVPDHFGQPFGGLDVTLGLT